MLQSFFEKYQVNEPVIAVGVSGGADSLALVLMLNEEFQGCEQRVVALTVEHGLRAESSAEAEYVAELMAAYKIEHHILIWEGEKPQRGIEEAARIARYGLLCDWCREHQVRTLAVAHHLFDQAETFLMRLQRGSGLNGLCGILPISEMDGIKIIRPFLNIHPQKLKDYLNHHHIRWVEDPSNLCDDYLRVRVRKFMPLLAESLGIGAERIADTMAVLSRSRDYLEEQTTNFVRHHVRYFGTAGVFVSRQQFCMQHDEIKYRVLSSLLKEIGVHDYVPRADDVERLLSRLQAAEFRGATLAGCEVLLFQGKLWIVPELKGEVKLSKNEWQAFADSHPQYAKIKIPYKLKLSLYKSS